MKLLSTVLAVFGSASLAHAADAKIQIDQTLSNHQTVTQKVTKDGVDAGETKTTDMNGTVGDLRVKIEVAHSTSTCGRTSSVTRRRTRRLAHSHCVSATM